MGEANAERSRGEAELVRRCVEGNEEAWNAFVDEYAPLVLRIARLRLQAHGLDPAGSEDVVQRVFVRLVSASCRRLRNFDPRRGRLAAYIAAVADHAARDWAASESRARSSRASRGLVMRTGFGQALSEAVDADFRERLEEKELASRLRLAAESLPPRERLALRLFYSQGLTYPEIALALGVTKGTVASTLSRAREALRTKLEAGRA